MELFGRQGPMNGDQELRRVGRCLQDMYPDGLYRAFLRDETVETLSRWAAAQARRPLLLVGEPLVGKTAIIHEWVRRSLAKRPSTFGGRAQTFLISPQRLTSGMSHVGQWEERWNSILKTAKKKAHVLYFDDLLGLFAAGQSASSNLSAAHVLKSYVDRRDVLVLGEMTPSELRVFREKDRGFADMFEVVQVHEPSSQESIHTLIQLLADLELRNSCRFGPEVVPNVLQLAQQFSTRGVLPGTAASVMYQLAAQHAAADISYSHCLNLFAQRTGLDPKLVDRQQALKRRAIEEFFEDRLIGQPDAVEAMVDVVGIAKAQLSDGKRPLSTLLFAGPTGVGKTEAAKLLAEYLFGTSERLLRFDLNEFVDPGSAQRLVGTFDRPDGLLTTAVRQQPYNVLLLDEIEKAHPEVFDLLLQVLGEGRLTDARGRTVDFSKLIIIMTSNVGAAQEANSIGFLDTEETAQQRFIAAIRRFWKPEFFNRIDRVIPFRRLSRDDLAKIANFLLSKLLQRDGFARRPVTVMGDRDAIDWVVDRGYSEKLGGRAMRRAVERDLVAPIAATMAGMLPEERAIIRMSRCGDGIETAVLPLEASNEKFDNRQWKFAETSEQFYEAANNYIDSMLDRCQNLSGAEAFEHTHPLAFERIATIDYLRQLKAKSKALANYVDDKFGGRSVIQAPNRPSLRQKSGRQTRHNAPISSIERRFGKEIHAFQDIEDFLNEEPPNMAGFDDVVIEDPDLALNSLIHDLRQLQLVVPKDDWNYERVVVLIRAFHRQGTACAAALKNRLSVFGKSRIDAGTISNQIESEEGLRVRRLLSESSWRRSLQEQLVAKPTKGSRLHSQPRPDWVVEDQLLGDRMVGVIVDGNNALGWAQPLVGTHVVRETTSSTPLQLIAQLIPNGHSAQSTVAQLVNEHEKYDCVKMDDSRDPFCLQSVQMNFPSQAGDREKWPQLISEWIASTFPLPAELEEQLK